MAWYQMILTGALLSLLSKIMRVIKLAVISDNYRPRCITLSHVISILFEMVLLKDLQKYLHSDSLQFGFKKKASCSQIIFTLRSVVDHNTKIGSTVTVCALDISKG